MNKLEIECNNKTYDNKFLKRILVATKVDRDTLLIGLQYRDSKDSKCEVYSLKKYGYINNINIYDLECDIELSESSIQFVIDIVSGNRIAPKEISKEQSLQSILYKHDYQISQNIFCEDNCNYNHVNDICATNLFNPPNGQTSYSVNIYDEFFNKSAISLFITN